MVANENDKSSIRLDKWLWAARFYKTRAIARAMIEGGKVRYNDQRSKPGKIVEGVGPDGPEVAATPSMGKLKDEMTKNPGKLLDYINISPVINDGKLKGYRVNPGKDVAFFQRIGLQSNDLAVSINGYDLRDNSQAMQIMQQLSSMTEMNLTVERNGLQQDIYIRLTE